MRNTKEQTAYIFQLRKERAALRLKRRKRIAITATAACLVLAAGVLALLTHLIGWPFQSAPAPGAYEIPILSVNGVAYSPISNRCALFNMDPSVLSVTAGQKIGSVGSKIGTDLLSHDSVGIFSNILKQGTVILAWSGYSPEFRVCARDSSGKLTGFERIGLVASLTEGRPVSELFDFKERVAEILICNNNPSEIGRITDPVTIANLMADFADQARFTSESRTDAVYVENQFYRLYLRFTDNSVTELVVNTSTGYGDWIENIKLPAGFAAAVSEHVLGSMSEEWLNYGNLCADVDRGIALNPGAAGLIRSDLYRPEAAWVNGTTGELYLGDAHNWQFRLADDARGEVRIEGQNIYYLTKAGSAARIVFAYPNDVPGLQKAAQAGTDLSAYVTRDVLAAGPFIRLQVRLGVIWTLGQDGVLRRDGVVIAQNIGSFALDPSGVTYSDGQAIWRRRNDGSIRKLAVTDAVTMAVVDITIYYSPSSGGIWRMYLDGSDNRKIYDLNARKIVQKNGMLAVLERNTGKIFLAIRDREMIDTAYRSDDVDLGLYQGLAFIDPETGNLKSVRYTQKSNGTLQELALE